jgi:hypothetical protein
LIDMKLLTILFAAAALASAAPSVVKIEKTASGFRLLRDGKPYYINGAAGRMHLDVLQRSGGNSIRAGAKELDDAQRRGLSVLFGLPFGKQRWGFDYRDEKAVAKQLAEIRAIVEANRDHPAVLMWAFGNESEIHTTPEQRKQLWKAMNDAALMVKKLDPNHPVITIIGGDYRRWDLLVEVKEQIPTLDAVGLNLYKDMLTAPADVAGQGWDKPYLITEFGPVGHWQVPKTSWKMPIEQTSSQKAEFYSTAYKHAVSGQPNCLGAYVFHWAQHHEKTHTWYGMFLDDASVTEAVDVMTLAWTGKWPVNRAPRIEPIRIHGEPVVAPGAELVLETVAVDPDGDVLKYTWDMRVDVADNPNVGGDREEPVAPIPGAVLESKEGRARVKLPVKPGPYRVFVYAHDGKGSAATANVPVLVR